MTASRVWKAGFVALGAALLVVMVAGVAHADVSFRKKAPATSDSSADQAAPSGGEPGTDEAAPAGEAAAPGPSAQQAEDKDTPEAQAQRDKARADAALARQARNEQLAKERERGTPFYQKWQFWAITGGVVVGAVLAIIAGSAVLHQIDGGDIRACNMTTDMAGCFGQGR